MVLIAVVAISVFGWWRAHNGQPAGASTINQLLLEVLSPAVRVAGITRNRLAPTAAPTESSPTPVGVERLRALAEENRQLRALLQLRDALPQTAIAAEIVGRDQSFWRSWQGNFLLDSGAIRGIEPGMAVITGDGVIGQVVAVSPHAAQVLPLTDRACGIGAMIARSGATGVLKGHVQGTCRLHYLSGEADIKPGDLVVTSGLGRVYPRGLPLGRVIDVKPDPVVSARIATVQPAANPSTAQLVLALK